MLTVHHLQKSQSERIVWLCEELGIPYELKIHKRDPKTFMSPPELQALHPTQAAPLIQDGAVTLAESGAIVEYILTKYGNGKLSVSSDKPNFADYLYFLHFSNSYFQSALLRYGLVQQMGATDSPSAMFTQRSFKFSLEILNNRLKDSQWLAGDEFTAADVMVGTTLTTMRLFVPYGFEGYDHIADYVKRFTGRPAYLKAREKGDDGFMPPISPEKPVRK